MRSLTERQWQLYFDLVDRLASVPAAERRAALPALRAEAANDDVAALLELHAAAKPDFDRCRRGERIRNLVLGERIGCGGMGTVYRATQAFADGIERDVAVKLIHPALLLHEPHAARQRFQNEIGMLVRLEHRGIARIYDGGIDRCPEHGDETLYLAMEWVRGKPLTEHVAEHRARLGTGGMLRLFLRVCDAVAHAHRHGIVHRDLKPANIVVDDCGEPRVVDFGLAAQGAYAEHAETVGGTPAYACSEQLAGAPATPAMDVYSLGVILHELLTGRRIAATCRADDLDRLRAAAGADLARVVATATAQRAAERYASAADFAQALSRCLVAIDARRATLRPLRAHLAAKVRAFWIDGVLEQSLRAALPIEPRLSLQPDAVAQPWAAVLQQPDHGPRPLPSGTRIAERFDACGSALLILGAPGAGKTTLLLQLAAALLERARHDDAEPVPVVFHLSTWAETRRPLSDWLVDELQQRYDVPPAVGRHGIDADAVVPLLDGLDEVAPAHRAACVAAINAFRRQRGMARLAVCSRHGDYDALPARLELAQAIVVASLTRAQIDAALQRAGEPLAGLRVALAGDAQLRELLSTPLLLGIAALTYQDHSVTAPAAATLAERRTQLFAAYTREMFARRAPLTRYDAEQTLQWLGWLANAMLQHHQSVFYLEAMQPSWLPHRLERWAVGAGSIVLCGLATGLVVGLGSSVEGDVAFRLPVSLLMGLAGGLVFGALGWGDRIRPIAGLHWSWACLRQDLPAKLTLALGVGLILHVGVSLVFDRTVAAALGAMAVLGFGYFAGLDRDMLHREPDRIASPNDGIRQSLRNALRGSVTGAALGAAAGALAAGSPGLLFCTAVFGLVMALIAGAHACLQHLMLRGLLWRGDCAPWQLVTFLEFAAERMLVRRVGGGYAFVHRQLLEYFAALHAARRGMRREGKSARPDSSSRVA
jgi:serine/threonine protein kinase